MQFSGTQLHQCRTKPWACTRKSCENTRTMKCELYVWQRALNIVKKVLIGIGWSLEDDIGSFALVQVAIRTRRNARSAVSLFVGLASRFFGMAVLFSTQFVIAKWGLSADRSKPTGCGSRITWPKYRLWFDYSNHSIKKQQDISIADVERK